MVDIDDVVGAGEGRDGTIKPPGPGDGEAMAMLVFASDLYDCYLNIMVLLKVIIVDNVVKCRIGMFAKRHNQSHVICQEYP